MRIITMLFAGVFVAACAHGGAPDAPARAQAKADEADAKLAVALSGMIAGPSQDCVNERDLGSNESYGGRVILFHDTIDDVVYVNRPPTGCAGLDSGRALRVRTPAARLCRGDVMTVFEPVSGMDLGSCSLGEFTPYRRALPPKSK